MNWKLWLVAAWFVFQILYTVALIGKDRKPRSGTEGAMVVAEASFILWCAITGAHDLAGS